MRCLVIGGTGLIGSSVLAACADRGYARLGTGYSAPESDMAPLDLRDADSIRELIADYQPDVTFLAAGPNDAAVAETNPTRCKAIIAGGAAEVAAAVARIGGSVVLFSGDEVFGECPTARREEDLVAPAGALARAHAAAEAAVRERLPDRHLILRAGWAFGPDERLAGAVQQWATAFAAGERVDAATDRHGQPTYAPDLAEVAVELARLGHTGTVHAVGPDRQTAFTFARLAAHIFGHDTDLIAATEGDVSPRPKRVWLDRFKLRTLLGARCIRGTADGLRAVRDYRTPATPLRRAA
ncbi:MAG: sugar nucleotide-binding protein [Gemmataceae bacterium]